MVVEYTWNLFSSVNLMWKKSIKKFFKLRIPLCQMIKITKVGKLMESDVLQLISEFDMAMDKERQHSMLL